MWSETSVFLRHEACPKCNSRDNLGVWSDGHKWCFGCGYFQAPDGTTADIVKRRLSAKPATTANAPVRLPLDSSFHLPHIALEWLDRYGVNQMMAAQWQLKWSSDEFGLILPIYNSHQELVMYQIRNFAAGKPKYTTHGTLGHYVPVYGKFENGIVVVVEDFLSARILGQHCNAVPLLGSHISKDLANRLSLFYSSLLIWLDQDKSKEALKFHDAYSYLFDSCEVLFTAKDPKAHNESEILDHVYGSFDYGDLSETKYSN